MRTIWILPGWFGFIIGSIPTGSEKASIAIQAKRLAKQAMAMVRIWHGRWSQRLDLEELPDHRLEDLGLTAWQARREAAKPFWRY